MSVISGPSTSSSTLVFSMDTGNDRCYSPNIVRYPTDYYTYVSSAGLNNCTISTDTATWSPVGNRPLKMVVTGNDAHIGSANPATWNLGNAKVGQTWTLSAYVMASQATTGEMFLFGADSTSAFDAGSSSWLWIASGGFNIGTDWTRVSFSGTITNNVPARPVSQVQFRLDGTNTGGAGTTIWWDGIQYERGSSPTPFNPNTNTNGAVVSQQVSTSTDGTIVDYPIFNSGFGGYLSFNGSNTAVICPEDARLNVQTVSVEVWVRPATLSQSGFWFEKGQVNTQYSLFMETGGPFIVWRATLGGVLTNLIVVNTSVLSTTSWNHVVSTFTSGTQRLYVNGVQVGTGTSSGTIDTNANGMSIGVYGGYNGARGFWYNGDIAMVKVYGSVLTADQVYANFNASRTRFGL